MESVFVVLIAVCGEGEERKEKELRVRRMSILKHTVDNKGWMEQSEVTHLVHPWKKKERKREKGTGTKDHNAC